MNVFKTFFLLVLMSALLVFLGRLFWGPTGMIIALGISIVMYFVSWFASDKIVLSMYHAQEVDENQAPEVYRMVRNLTQEANLPMPKVYIVPSDSPNAFATGRDPQHAAIAFTQGILNTLNYNELSAVAAHELSHVKNRDSLVMTIAAILASAIGMLASWARWAAIFGGIGGGSGDRRGGGGLEILVWALLAPLIALLIQLSISRTREFGADASGAHITGQPLALADALRKINAMAQIRPQSDLANPSTANLWFASPFNASWMRSLFSTHPPVEERIKRLEKMAGM